MKFGTKKSLKFSLKPLIKPILVFLLQPVGSKQDFPRIEEQEMEIFSLLHQNGLPFLDNVELSFTQKEAIVAALNQGESFSTLIQKQKAKRMKQLGTLLNYFALDEAIVYDGKLRQARETLLKKLFHHSIYPLFLMTFSTGLVWFFSQTILPAFGEFQSSDSRLLDCLGWFTTLFWIGILLFSLFLGSLFVLDGSKNQTTNFLFQIPLVKIVASMECAALLECTQKSSLSPLEPLSFMEINKRFPCGSLFAKRWHYQLKQGKSLAQCIAADHRLDPTFQRFFSIGVQGSTMSHMMAAYQKSALLILEKKVKHLSNWLLYLAYGCVGILAACVYQIMLEPLTMLESF